MLQAVEGDHKPQELPVKVICVGGASRSGKGTLAWMIKEALSLPHWAVVHCDAFFDVDGIMKRSLERLKQLAGKEEFLRYIEDDPEELENAKNFAEMPLGSVMIPMKLTRYAAEFGQPNERWENWEEPAAMDWGRCQRTVKEVIAHAAEQNVEHIIVEGYTIMMKDWPLPDVHCSKAIFMCIDKETSSTRRSQTKPVPEGYFDQLIWPEHIKAHRHLIPVMEALTSNTVDKSEYKGWIEQHGGDLLVLDGTSDTDTIGKQAISFIKDETKSRDRSPELELVCKAIKE